MRARFILAALAVASLLFLGFGGRNGAREMLHEVRGAFDANRVIGPATLPREVGRPLDLARRDLDENAEEALERAALLGAVVGEVVHCIERRSDYVGAVSLVEAVVSAGERDRFMREIVCALLAREPKWAANFALALPCGAARDAGIDRVAKEFAGRDPAQALQWAAGLPTGATRSIAFERIVGQVADSGFAASVESLAALPVGLARDDAVCSLAAQWAQRDAAGALEWASNLSDSPLRPRVIASIGFELAQADPEVAQQFAKIVTSPSDHAMLIASIQLSLVASRPGAQRTSPERRLPVAGVVR